MDNKVDWNKLVEGPVELTEAEMEYAVQTILSHVPESQWLSFQEALELGIAREAAAAAQLEQEILYG